MKSSTVLLIVIAVFYVKCKNTKTREHAAIEALTDLLRGSPISEEYVCSARGDVVTKWIKQKVDNFNDSDDRTWSMRYFENAKYFKPNGTMFILVGGEWDISDSTPRLTHGHFVDLAKEHNGMLYHTEHRYYGKSQTTSDLSLDNLRYLHVKQALADLAHFISYQRTNVANLANSKVIMVGASYSGSMIVWFKHLYPELMAGGWASSAPLIHKVEFPEYLEFVGHSFLKLGGAKCYKRIENGIAALEQMFVVKRGAEVKSMFNLCSDFDEHNNWDVATFFVNITDTFAGVVQNQHYGDIVKLCSKLLSFADDLEAIVKFVVKKKSPCMDLSYKRFVAELNTTIYNGMMRSWFYQICNEYGNFQTTNSKQQPFGTKVSLSWHIKVCEDVYGIPNATVYSNVEQTNADFGGMHQNVENIYMTHGELDPWLPAGHKEGATVIPDVAHCKDFDSLRGSDSLDMQASKKRLARLVREWLKD